MIISGPQVVSMDLSGVGGMSWKSIFVIKIHMNIIEKNNSEISYMPRYDLSGVYRSDSSKNILIYFQVIYSKVYHVYRKRNRTQYPGREDQQQ